jgi:hypothetical protein
VTLTDNQTTRNQVFDIIEKNLADVAVDSIIVEKQRVATELRQIRRGWCLGRGSFRKGLLEKMEGDFKVGMNQGVQGRKNRQGLQRQKETEQQRGSASPPLS